MFTGLIQDVGRIKALRRTGRFAVFEVETRLADEGLRVGDSLAVMGACLTAVKVRPGVVDLEAVAETLSRTTLGRLSVGDRVNLERALQVSDRLDGHIVQGHVDGTGIVRSLRRDGPALLLEIGLAPDLLRHVVEKGSIAVDGISLTVATLLPQGFVVSIIPHTLGQTTLDELAVGDRVNIETDILAKYVERLLSIARPDIRQAGNGVTLEMLARNGFIE